MNQGKKLQIPLNQAKFVELIMYYLLPILIQNLLMIYSEELLTYVDT